MVNVNEYFNSIGLNKGNNLPNKTIFLEDPSTNALDYINRGNQLQQQLLEQTRPNIQQNTFDIQTENKEIDPNLAESLLNKYIDARNKYNKDLQVQAIVNAIGRPLAKRQDERARRYNAYMGVASQNPYLGQMASSSLSPYGVENYDLNTANVQQINKDRLAKVSDLNTILGNIVASKEAGFNPAVAFANKDQLTTLGAIKKAQDQAENRMQVAQLIQDTKKKMNDLNLQYKYFAKQGDWANAQKVAQIMSGTRLQVANILAKSGIARTGLTYGLPDDIADQYGLPAIPTPSYLSGGGNTGNIALPPGIIPNK